jgi:hypothetical protein
MGVQEQLLLDLVGDGVRKSQHQHSDIDRADAADHPRAEVFPIFSSVLG